MTHVSSSPPPPLVFWVKVRKELGVLVAAVFLPRGAKQSLSRRHHCINARVSALHSRLITSRTYQQRHLKHDVFFSALTLVTFGTYDCSPPFGYFIWPQNRGVPVGRLGSPTAPTRRRFEFVVGLATTPLSSVPKTDLDQIFENWLGGITTGCIPMCHIQRWLLPSHLHANPELVMNRPRALSASTVVRRSIILSPFSTQNEIGKKGRIKGLLALGGCATERALQ